MKPSQTAQLAAAHRAYHLIHDRPAILGDTAAIWLLGPPLSVILRAAPLRKIFWDRLLDKVRPVSAFVVVRSRYAEDCLDRFVTNGCRQYVILGAGLDSWALRHEMLDMRVFELDQPDTQRWKEARDVLRNQPYDRDARAFVSWLGTICYLTRGAIDVTLASLATVCASGSRIVFDYFQPKSTMSPADLHVFEVLDQGSTRRGEPMKALFNPREVAGILHSVGWGVVEDLSASEIRDRFLRGRSDGLDIPGFARLCYAERAA